MTIRYHGYPNKVYLTATEQTEDCTMRYGMNIIGEIKLCKS